MTSMSPITGTCLCGAVRIAIRPASTSVGVCHCGTCRKWSGGPLFAVECGDDVRFEGSESISTFDSSDWAERGFCSNCGTHLFYRLKNGGMHAIPVGLLDNGGDWLFDQQIFIEQKPPYYTFANSTRNLTGAEVFAQFTDQP